MAEQFDEQVGTAPVDLSAEREARREGYTGVFCACGEAWFNANIVIDRDGSVSGYEWPPTCVACGLALESTHA